MVTLVFWYGSGLGEMVTHECLTVASIKDIKDHGKCSRKTIVTPMGSIISEKKANNRSMTESVYLRVEMAKLCS